MTRCGEILPFGLLFEGLGDFFFLDTLGSTFTISGRTKFISNYFMGMFVRFGRRRKVGIPNITEVTKLS